MSLTLTAGSFEKDVLQSNKPVLVDFWAEWCGPCKVLEPIVDEVEKSLGEKLVVGKIDVDAHPELSQRYGVMSIPTLLLFKDSEPVETIIGVIPKPELEAKLTPHL